MHGGVNSDEALLASLGYKQEFRRAFAMLETFGVEFSIIAVAPSLASTLSISMSNGGAAVMVWGWAIASLFILCVGTALAEVASSAPTAGGLYYLTYRISSVRSRKIFSWIVGWLSTMSTVGGLASGNWGSSVQIAAAASIGTNLRFSPTAGQSYAIYVALIITQATLSSLGTRVIARLQIVYIISNLLLCAIVIIALPIATPAGLRNSPAYAFGNITNMSGWPDSFAFFLGMLAPIWTIGGYDAAIHISEEVTNAAIAAPRAIIASIAISGVLGFALNIVLAFCMGTDTASILNSPVGSPMAQIMLNSIGRTWTLVSWSLLMTIQIMGGANLLLVASRQMFAFARDGVLPFSKLLRRLNGHTQTPINALWAAAFIVLILGLLSFCGPIAVNALFSIAITAQNIAFTVPIAARLAFKDNFKPGPFTLGSFSVPIAIIAVLFMTIISVVICFPSGPSPTASNMNYTSAVIGGIILFALTWYYFPIYGGVYWYEGPVVNVTVPLQYTSEGQVKDAEKPVTAGISIS